MERQREATDQASDGPLDTVLRAVRTATHAVNGNLGDHVGVRGETNPSGDDQTAADVWADRLLFDHLAPLGPVGAYASEEREAVVDCGEGYSVAVDPLDGSANLASNNSVGTIVGVYDAPLPATGRSLVAATMVLYGPYTTMTVAREDDDSVRQYRLTDGLTVDRGEYAIPDEPGVVGLAGKTRERSDAVNAFAAELERDLKLRYGGATVADLAQVLEYGGLFGYPATTRYPDGKLRTLFEAAPLAYILAASGGGSTDGRRSLLDVDPDGLHDRTPTFLGNTALVERAEAALDE